MNTGDSIQASIIPDLESPCLYLDISVNGRQLSALFDTGSPISVVTAELCGDREVLPYGNRFRSCTGHSLDIVGYTIMDFVFESRLCPIPCVVVRNSAYPVLLGMNWIRKHIQPEDDIWRAHGQDDGNDVRLDVSPIHETSETQDDADDGGILPLVESPDLTVEPEWVEQEPQTPCEEQWDTCVGLVQADEMAEMQGKDPYCVAMRDKPEFVTRKGILHKVYSVGTGPVYRIVVPAPLREILVAQAHESITTGHVGSDKTFARIQQGYFWPGMRSLIEEYVKSCKLCQKRNLAKRQLKAPLQMLPIVGVFQRLFMDYVICPKSSRGHTSILTVICSTSKFLVAIPMRSQTAVATAGALLERVFLIYGFPVEIFSDRGTNFISQVVRGITGLLGIHSKFSSAYSPHSSGQVERVNQSIIDILSKTVADEPLRWSDLLQYAVWAYNSAVHSSTGYSPYQVVFGIVPKDPSLDALGMDEGTPLVSIEDHVRHGFTHVRDKVRANIERARASYKKMADRSVRRDPPFVQGEQIMMKSRDGQKFDPRYVGPYEIRRIINPASLWVRDETGREFSVNVDKCKRYVGRKDYPREFDFMWEETAVPKTQENAQVTIPPKPLSPQTQENAQVTIPPKPLSPQIQIAQGPIVPRPPSPQTPLSPGPGQHIPSPTQPSTSWAGAHGFTPPLPPPLPMQQSTSRAGVQGFVPPLPPSPPMQQDPRPQRRPQTPRPRGDSNPSRRPIERDPYLLRDRSGSRGKR